MRSTLAAAALLMTFVAVPHSAPAQTVGVAPPSEITEIGRASCRERVCLYV